MVDRRKSANKLLAEAVKVLLRCVGDNRECPKCRHSFIPNGKTEIDAFALYKKILASGEVTP